VRRQIPSNKPTESNGESEFDTKKSPRPSNHPPTGTRTGTACPACGNEQMWCPSGVVCSDFEKCDGDDSANQGYPSDIPFVAPKEPQEQTLDEALAEHPDRQPKPRKRQAKCIDDVPRDSLSLGEMGRIVERVFKFDFDEAYDTVQRFLEPGDDRRLDLGFLQRELDRSAEMATLAHRLFTNAREACEIFEIDRDLIVSSMREEARHKLEEDKRNRIRLKPITDADVLGMMKMQDPAKWRDLRVKTVRMEATKDHLERIADLARKRIDILKTLVERK
jgi:hypothetical protein